MRRIIFEHEIQTDREKKGMRSMDFHYKRSNDNVIPSVKEKKQMHRKYDQCLESAIGQKT